MRKLIAFLRKRADILLGVATGLVAMLAYGKSALAAVDTAWATVVLPAFYSLSTTGLAWCG